MTVEWILSALPLDIWEYVIPIVEEFNWCSGINSGTGTENFTAFFYFGFGIEETWTKSGIADM